MRPPSPYYVKSLLCFCYCSVWTLRSVEHSTPWFHRQQLHRVLAFSQLCGELASTPHWAELHFTKQIQPGGKSEKTKTQWVRKIRRKSKLNTLLLERSWWEYEAMQSTEQNHIPKQQRKTLLPGGIKALRDLCKCAHYLGFLFWSKIFVKFQLFNNNVKVNGALWKALLKWIWTWKCRCSKSSVEFFNPLACAAWLLTDKGGWGQFDLVHAVDGAVGAHAATYCEAVQHFTRLDQCFASHADRKFTVCLRQRGKTSHQNNWIYNIRLYSVSDH